MKEGRRNYHREHSFNLGRISAIIENIVGDYRWRTRVKETVRTAQWRVARGETRVDESRRFSWCVTPGGHLSRVSLHPTFTDTMSLRSILQPSSATFHSLPSRNREGFLVMGFHSAKAQTLHLVICIVHD